MSTILMIEDDLLLRDSLEEFLEYEGFDTIKAANGCTGKRLAQEHLPDLILCDIVLPELNGYEILAELRKDPCTAAIPCIFLSAQAAIAGVRKDMIREADEYLTKPCDMNTLLSAIRRQLLIHAHERERGSMKV